MKCPLLLIDDPFNGRRADFTRTNCLQEECAWWEDTIGKCSIRRIWIALQDIHEVLHDIAKDKRGMPHG